MTAPVLLILLLAAATPAAAADGAGPADALHERLAYYRDTYPDFTFLNLTGGASTRDDLMRLHAVLGPAPASLDYEHPPELRELLMRASLGRIQLMLAHQMPSAALFMADRPGGGANPVCVLTIDPLEAGADDEAATRSLLQLSDAEFGNVPKDVHLNPADYLLYLVDHEIYHCLHARFVGPQPMSMLDYWAEYQHYLAEKGADAYAMAMHLRERGERTRFAENILRIRSLSLYTQDPDHFTCDALQQVMNMPVAEVAALDPHGAFALAVEVRDRLDPGYEGYLQYLGSALAAMDRLGIADLDPQLRDHAGTLTIDEALVERLVDRTRECMRTLQLSP